MSSPATAARGATLILEAYRDFENRFSRITGLAQPNFEAGAWHEVRRCARERLSLYPKVVNSVLDQLTSELGQRQQDRNLWRHLKNEYQSLIQDEVASAIAETFYNSVCRRVFATVGVDPTIEFLGERVGGRSPEPAQMVSIERHDRLTGMILDVFDHLPFETPLLNPDDQAHRVAQAIRDQRRSVLEARPVEEISFLPQMFFRGQRAYLVGRLRSGIRASPVVLAFASSPDGIVVDAVLLTEEEVSILFSFTRSCFHVQIDDPPAVVAVLKSIMPAKPTSELYSALGFNKHGKTLLYRELIDHLATSEDQFAVAPGERGMVMLVFAAPSFDVVFKVIRDRFANPKSGSRQDVMDKYDFVFKHDRAGRLLDIHEFEHLEFPRERFSHDLLRALSEEAARTVDVSDDRVVIKHLYTERRTEPLNLYLQTASAEDVAHTLRDYAQAIRDLAVTNVFPGDLLIKNFGVTRHGRVVFYDYDEICYVTDCTFRELPQGSADEDDLRGEPWFYVGPSDIFPEELAQFLGLPRALREMFESECGDILTADYWRTLQHRLKEGEVIEVLPYPEHRRIRESQQ